MSINYSADRDNYDVEPYIHIEDVCERIDDYLESNACWSSGEEKNGDWHQADYLGNSYVFEDCSFGQLKLFWIRVEYGKDGSVFLTISLDNSPDYTISIVYDKTEDALSLDLLYFGTKSVPSCDENDFSIEDVKLAELVMDMIRIVNPHTGKTINDLMDYDVFEDRRSI